MVLEFFLTHPAAVDAKYVQPTDAGYQGHRALLGAYLAMGSDPDGKRSCLPPAS